MIKEYTQKNTLHKVTVLLLVLLLCSLVALAARAVYLRFFMSVGGTSVVTDNHIGQEEVSSARLFALPATAMAGTSSVGVPGSSNVSAQLSLHKGQTIDNQPFQVANMLPGDRETKTFALTLSHHADTEVYFRAVVTEETKHLSDILSVTVTHKETGLTLYDGTFAALSEDGVCEVFPATGSTQTVATYLVDVSLPTSAGNEYQAAMLAADFQWWVANEDVLDPPPPSGVDGLPLLWIAVGAVALVAVILLLRRKEQEDDRHD